MEKRLYRSNKNSEIGGVCGGIAEYLDVDPTLVRLIWVISALYGGVGVVAYIICIIVIPENKADTYHCEKENVPVEEEVIVSAKTEEADFEKDRCDTKDQYSPKASDSSERNRLLAGTLLICIGGLLLFRKWFYWIDLGRYWPVLLIVAGLVIIIKGTKNKGEFR
jgi:phage shock protein C